MSSGQCREFHQSERHTRQPFLFARDAVIPRLFLQAAIRQEIVHGLAGIKRRFDQLTWHPWS
jgi:hypothetical protein